MKSWPFWCMVWIAVGIPSLVMTMRGLRRHGWPLQRTAMCAAVAWLFFSLIAGEAMCLYLRVYQLPLDVIGLAFLGFSILGLAAAGATRWFIGGQGFRLISDLAAGVLGATVAGWSETVLSYNHVEYVIVLSGIGGVFFVFISRLFVLSLSEPSVL